MKKIILSLIVGAFLLAPFADVADACRLRRRCRLMRRRHCCCCRARDVSPDESPPIVDFKENPDTGELQPVITDEIKAVMQDPDNLPLVEELITDEIKAELKDPSNLPLIKDLEGVTTESTDEGETVTVIADEAVNKVAAKLATEGKLGQVGNKLVEKLLAAGKLRRPEAPPAPPPPAPLPAPPAAEEAAPPAPPAPPAPAPAV